MSLRRIITIGLLSLTTLAGGLRGAEETESRPAKLKVTGMGWWKNRELKQTLQLLEPEDRKLTELDAAMIEDAVVLLQSSLERDGFLHPSGVVRLERGGEELGEYPWESGDVPRLPRDIAADNVTFLLKPGIRYRIETLTFTGLVALEEEAARAYFLEEGFVFDGGNTRRFTPGVLRNGVANLREQLVRMGYGQARVAVTEETRDDASGEVTIAIAVEEGPQHLIGSVTLQSDAPEPLAQELRDVCASATDAIDSPLWQQDYVQGVRAMCYIHGYANAVVRLEAVSPPVPDGTNVRSSFRLVVTTGPQVRVGTVHFNGEHRTSERLLRRATKVDSGDLFDRSRVEADRLRLGSLGAFRSVQVSVDPVAPDVWDLNYELRPAKRIEASLLAGYGSYEGLRGGVEVLHANTFKRAHRGRLQLIVSEKSAYGDYLYTVPQIFGTGVDASARVFGLQREEVSFDREELGVSVGARRRIEWLKADASVRYQFESINADVFDPDAATDAPTDSNVGSLTFDLARDRLDNPIAPRRGHFLALSLETAAEALGGQVDYQRLDLRASWHRRIGREKYLHLGLRHGVLWALGGSASQDIPLARRYFPGGEGTVRGYVEGKATPRDSNGTVMGAEVSTIANVEFEQGLTKSLSAVLFVDAGLTAASLSDYPGNETRISVGLGLRFNSVIGPARLEYGRNVVRETGDGRDAWHLALGFPF